MVQRRRTKIIATLGPATDDPTVLAAAITAGIDLVRLNFSHGLAEDHQQRIKVARECAKNCGREIGVIADLQGPKIRIGLFTAGKVILTAGDEFTLIANGDTEHGDEHHVGLHYPQLLEDVNVDDILLLDDGRIELKVKSVKSNQLICEVRVGGELSNNKGINRLGGGLSAKALTDKDKADLQTAVDMGCDYLAISFPRSADDIHEARELMLAAGGKAGIIAKIERAEAVQAIDEIIQASDAVMVARGDLGVEIGDSAVPSIQKLIINRARALDKAVITATQMMESMIHNSIPTRAEVSDVANAVIDGTDAVMLSAETATGDHPTKVVTAMARVILGAEQNPIASTSKHRLERKFEHTDEAIAMAAMYTANHLNIKAIICLTESGSTPLWMSRIRSGIPIYALTRHLNTERKVTLYRGVYAMGFDPTKIDRREINRRAVDLLQQQDLVEDGDLVIVTKGDFMGTLGGTNAMKIVSVGPPK